ncbi:MAG: secondary thiamine-phosphate synthase enzyme YjbQ [Thermoplasmatales archaeon]|nr:secondary thiamine-phosphate synthase enzyme YjbQ [Thermoplasmatales archaeon]MCK5636599.1 secondary thiamine-phosphate synthase enzyme YjbQ [Thermoplasmatales archaeon]
MVVYHSEININSKGENDIINITDEVQEIVKKSGLSEGICCIFIAGSTGTLSTIEYEDGLKYDFPKALEKIAPKNQEYLHHETWHDDNGRSHVKATLMGASLTIPFQNKKIIHGTWQQLIFMELDTKPRNRDLIIQLVGE